MPTTRAAKAKSIEAEEKKKTTSESAKSGCRKRSISTISRQYLQNITNQDSEMVGEVPLRRSPRKHRSVPAIQGSKGKEDRTAGVYKTRTATTRESVSKSRGSSLDGTETSRSTKKFKQIETNLKAEPVPPIRRQKRGRKKLFSKDENDTGKEEHDENAKKPVVVVVDDGEKPSTSKSAIATAAASSHATDMNYASTSDNKLCRNSLNSVKSMEDLQAKDESPDSRKTTSPSMMDKTNECMTLSDKLRLVLSSLYLNAAERLKLDFVPRCADDFEYCHQHHYRAPLPEAPNHTQANNLRCALQQQRYLSFVSLLYGMCHRDEYPGEGILTKIIELILSFNPKCFNHASIGYFVNKSIEIFSFIVRKFPPCWLSLRPFYVYFFRTPPDSNKIFRKNQTTLKSESMFEVLLELLESTLELCSSSDLQSNCENFSVPANAAISVEPSASTTDALRSPSTHHLNNDNSQNSEYLNIWEWEVQENRRQTFEALEPRIRLVRLFTSLRLLLQILENDLVMWILHHHKKAKAWIFCEQSRPFVVQVLSMTKYTRTTRTVKQLFKLFAICINKGVHRAHLLILERLISLSVASSNIADLEHSAMGVHYPNLGVETKTLIHEFFKTFKAHNITCISSYLNAIDLLRLPYVRCEFVDLFLNNFYFPQHEPLTPKKITNDIFKKRWLKYNPQAEQCEDGNDKIISREQYLKVLLSALQAYCEWHGTKELFSLLIKGEVIDRFKTVTDSVHHCPVKGSGSLMLENMTRDIKKLEKQLRMTVRVGRPKVNLPLVNICINDELLQKYRNDLKWLMLLSNLIDKEETKKNKKSESSENAESTIVNFAEWNTFLLDYRAEENEMS